MISDMQPEYIVGDYKECTLDLYGGIRRKIFYTEIETPYPDGKLIVSTTDPEVSLRRSIRLSSIYQVIQKRSSSALPSRY